MTLDPRVIALMAEAFSGRVCCKCEKPAQRCHRGKFYCPDHAPGRRRESQEAAVHRDRYTNGGKFRRSE